MPVFFSSLNSGSNGNCYYIGNSNEAVLIDAGISCRETEKRMKRIGLSMDIVRAIFISHEHSDHITGVPGISKKYQLPVYITKKTFQSSNIPIEKHLIHSFDPYKEISIGGLSIIPFPKFHDAVDPHSFMISCNNINIGVFTDIGSSCKHVIRHFKECHAAFLESNYCEDMLAKGSYPVFLKKRISGDDGHLSNAQALELFLKHKNKQLSHLILSHLSKNNNSMKLVESIFTQHAGSTEIVVASRYKETKVFCIEESEKTFVAKNKSKLAQAQLSLF
ncbi:MAG TPA: MBL fold metallo-hydrolase [Puia sp.]|nr:MBL fold metallo-hydrolase [Puia sp.]